MGEGTAVTSWPDVLLGFAFGLLVLRAYMDRGARKRRYRRWIRRQA